MLFAIVAVVCLFCFSMLQTLFASLTSIRAMDFISGFIPLSVYACKENRALAIAEHGRCVDCYFIPLEGTLTVF